MYLPAPVRTLPMFRHHGMGAVSYSRRRRRLGATAVNTWGAASAASAALTTATISAVAAPTISVAASAGGGIAASGAASGLAAAAGPIGLAVGAVVALIGALWSAHAARAKGAKTENAAMNSAVQAFDGSMQAIFQAANSGSIAASDAINLCNQVYQQYWAGMAPFMTGPGRADASHGGAGCPQLAAAQAKSNQCNKNCTAGCCVGCMDLYPGISNAIAVFQAGGGTANFPQVFSSGYGGQTRAAYSLTYSPAGGSGGSVASLLGLTGSTIAGIPTWLLLVAGGGLALYYSL